MLLTSFWPLVPYGAVAFFEKYRVNMVAGDIRIRRFCSALVGMLVVVFGLSLAGHKEHRFLLPLVPLLTLVAAQQYKKMNESDSTSSKVLIWLMFGIQAVLGAFFIFGHQRARLPLIKSLTTLPADKSVFFMTPCHATPWLSHVHEQRDWTFLDCSPPMGHSEGSEEALQLSLRDQFFDEPVSVLCSLFPDSVFEPASETNPGGSKGCPQGIVPAVARKAAPGYQCLQKLYDITPRATPDYIALWESAVVQKPALGEWLIMNNYAQLPLARFFDSIASEGPFDLEMWPTIVILKKIDGIDVTRSLANFRRLVAAGHVTKVLPVLVEGEEQEEHFSTEL